MSIYLYKIHVKFHELYLNYFKNYILFLHVYIIHVCVHACIGMMYFGDQRTPCGNSFCHVPGLESRLFCIAQAVLHTEISLTTSLPIVQV